MLPEPPTLPPLASGVAGIERAAPDVAELGKPPVHVATVPPARPGHFAEREELDAAIKAGTAAALQLFIRRHPNSRYRIEAEERLRAIGGANPN